MALLGCFFPVDLFFCFDVIVSLSILTGFSANDNYYPVKRIIMIFVNLISNYFTSMIYGKLPVSLHSLYLMEWLLGHL